MHREHRLGLLGFDGHKAHVRPPDRFADRLGVGGVVLATLAVRDHELRRHQAHVMAEPDQLARPVVRTCARFNADQAGGTAHKETEHLAASERLAQHRLAPGIHAMNL